MMMVLRVYWLGVHGQQLLSMRVFGFQKARERGLKRCRFEGRSWTSCWADRVTSAKGFSSWQGVMLGVGQVTHFERPIGALSLLS